MKNKKGFTLVELLVVIALIAVITTSISVAMFNMLDNQQDNLSELEIENVENAACTYAEIYDKRNECKDDSESGYCIYSITIEDLVLDGYLDENDYKKVLTSEVKVTWNSDGLKECEYGEE